MHFTNKGKLKIYKSQFPLFSSPPPFFMIIHSTINVRMSCLVTVGILQTAIKTQNITNVCKIYFRIIQ